MSVDQIRSCLTTLQEEPENDSALATLDQLLDSAAVDGVGPLIETTRQHLVERGHAELALHLLEREIRLAEADPDREVELQLALAKVAEEDLLDAERSTRAYERVIELRPGDGVAVEALERIGEEQQNWKKIAERFEQEAESATDATLKTSLYVRVAETHLRHRPNAKEVPRLLKRALEIEPRNRRAAILLERSLRRREKWDELVALFEHTAEQAASRDDRIDLLLKAGRLWAEKLDDRDRAAQAYSRVLEIAPGHPAALRFLVGYHTEHEQWDKLVALYEDALRSRTTGESEQAMLLQIGMVNWRMRADPDAAEPYFQRLRKVDPMHPGALEFFREYYTDKGDQQKLSQILSDAQRLASTPEHKVTLAIEVAKNAENGRNVEKAIDAWKAVFKLDPKNAQAPSALMRLYERTEKWNALVDLLKAEIDSLAAEDVAGRLSRYRRMVSIYRDKLSLDVMVINTYNAILQLDPQNAEALGQLATTYESMGRWNDLIGVLGRRVEGTERPAERVDLLHRIAQLWIERFANYNQAVRPLEDILGIDPHDRDALGKLKDIYQKKRAWKPLYDVLKREADLLDGHERCERIVEMARLAADRLEKPAEAIAHWREAIELDPQIPGALDALERLTERERDFASLAVVLERRLDVTQDDEAKVLILQKLGAVLAERLGDAERAAAVWSRILEIKPGHQRALRTLRDAHLSRGDWAALEELYGRQGDWEGLVDVMGMAADRTSDPALKIRLSFRVAQIYAEHIGEPQRALRSFERILQTDPQNSEAANALVPIYEKEEKWHRLLQVLEIVLAHAGADADKIETLQRIAGVVGDRLGDRLGAFRWAAQAFELKPDDPAVRRTLEHWAAQADSFQELHGLYEQRLAVAVGDERAALQRRLARMAAENLGKLDDAVQKFEEILEDDPGDEEALSALESIFRSTQQWKRLLGISQRRLEREYDTDVQRTILIEMASIEEQALDDIDAASALYRTVLELNSADLQALTALERLAAAAHRWEELASILTRRRDLVEEAEAADLSYRLGELRAQRLGDHHGALDEFRRVLGDNRRHAGTIAALERMLTREDVRAEVAELLEPVFEEAKEYAKLAWVLQIQLESSGESARRLPLYLRLASIYDTQLGDGRAAFDTLGRAMSEDPSDEGIWAKLAELGGRLNLHENLAKCYAAAVKGGKLSADAAAELSKQLAEIYDDRLGRVEEAEEFYQRVLERDSTAVRPFEALERLYTTRERWQELLVLYRKRVEVTFEPEPKVELLLKLCFLYEEVLDDPDSSINAYQAVLELAPEHPQAFKALEKLYASTGRFRDLAALLDRALTEGHLVDASSPASRAERIDVRFRLGELFETRLGDPAGAVDCYSEVLAQDPLHLHAQSALERLLANANLRQRVAAILEPLYRSQGASQDLARILEVQLEDVADSGGRVGLLLRIGELREKRLKDPQGAFEAYGRAFAADPADPRPRDELRRLADGEGRHGRYADTLATGIEQSSDNPSLQAELLVEAAQLSESRLKDVDRAILFYRRLLDIDRSDPATTLPAAQALERIYQSRAESSALVDVLRIQTSFADDLGVRKQLLARVSQIEETTLQKPAAAIETHRQILDLDPTDSSSLDALERLYTRTSAWPELIGVLRMREGATTDASERRALSARIAAIYEDKLDDVDNAVIAYNTVLDASPEDREAIGALVRLYERMQKWPDLLDLLEIQLRLATKPAERAALLFRMAELRRTRTGEPERAIEALRDVITADPKHPGARAALESMLGDDLLRLEAARVLGPLYEQEAAYAKLLGLIEIEADATDDPAERLRLWVRGSQIADMGLSDLQRAFDLLGRALRVAVGDPQLPDLLDQIERLIAPTGRFADLCGLYREIAPDILDERLRLRVLERVAQLARDPLGDLVTAREFYQQILELRADYAPALDALETLQAEAGEYGSLRDVLRRKIELATDPAAKKQLLFREAKLAEEELKNKAAAVEVYEAILEMGPDREATSALERLYAEAGRFGDLAAILERRIEERTGNAVDLNYRLGQIAAENTGDADRAVAHYRAVLAVDARHEGTIAALERMLADPERRVLVAEILEPIYLGRMDWPRVVAALEARIEAESEPAGRKQLMLRLGTLYEEHLEDLDAAFSNYARLFRENIEERDVWDLLQRLARVLDRWDVLGDIFMGALEEVIADTPATADLAFVTGQIFDERTGDTAAAKRFYRRALDFDPTSKNIFPVLEALLVRTQSWDDLLGLYRSAVDAAVVAAEKRPLLLKTARVFEQSLKDSSRAIDTYREILELDARDANALESLDRLLVQQERWNELTDLIVQRIDDVPEGKTRSVLRLRLGTVREQKLREISGAIDCYEEVLQKAEKAEALLALQALERLVLDFEQRYRIAQILEPVYKASDEWRKLVVIYDAELEFISDRVERVQRLQQIAHIHESRGGDLKLAANAIARAFVEDPSHADLRGELERLAGVLGAYDELVTAMEKGLENVLDATLQVDILSRIARTHEEKRGDPRGAIDAWQRTLKIDESNEAALDALEGLFTLIADWQGLIQVLEKKIDRADGDAVRIETLHRIAKVFEELLNQTDKAIETERRVIEIDSANAAALEALDRMYLYERNFAALIEVLRKRLDAVVEDVSARLDLMLRIARAYEQELRDTSEAIAAFRAILDEMPHETEALGALERIYLREQMWSELLENLRTQVEAAPTSAAKARALYRVASLEEDKLGDPEAAIAAYREVLALDPDFEDALTALERIARDEAYRAPAAAVLDPLHEAAGRWDRLVGIRELRLQAMLDPRERIDLLRSIASIHESARASPAGAFNAYVRALAEDPGDESLIGEMERVSTLEEGLYEKLAEAYEVRVASALDPAIARLLCLRLGAVYEWRLGDDASAIDAYRRGLEHGGDEAEALESLDRLYTKVRKATELALVIEKRIAAATDALLLNDLDLRLGILREVELGDPLGALTMYRDVIGRDPANADARDGLERLAEIDATAEGAIDLLEPLYRQAQDLVKVAGLFERRIALRPSASERAGLLMELAATWETQIGDPMAALAVLKRALGDDPADGRILDEIERLAQATGGWAELSGVAEAIAAREEIPREAARGLLLRAARWYLDGLGDPQNAETCLRGALEIEPDSDEALGGLEEILRRQGREPDRIGVLRRRAELQMDVTKKKQMLREVATIAAANLSDNATAAEALEALLEADDTDIDALGELSRLREAEGNWEGVCDLLRLRARLATDPEQAAADRLRIAEIYATAAPDLERAIGAYREVLDADPGSTLAIDALERLYVEAERWPELQELLQKKLDAATEVSEQVALRRSLARLAEEKFGATQQALDEYRLILQIDSENDEVFEAAERLLERLERWGEMVELLNGRAGDAAGRGDVERELQYLVRAGEIYEQRLDDVQRAVEIYERVIERDPNHVRTLGALARLHEAAGEWAKCAAVLERAAAQAASGPEAAGLHYRLGRTRLDRIEDAAGAEAAFLQALELDPNHADAAQALRQLYRDRGDAEGILRMVLFDEARETRPDGKRPLLIEAARLQRDRLKNPAAAVELIERALAMGPEDREVLAELADLLTDIGRQAEAMPILQKIIASFGGKRSKDLAGYHHRLGRAIQASGDRMGALAQYDAAFKIDLTNVPVLRDLGRVCMDLGDLDRSQKAFRALLLQKLDAQSGITKADVCASLAEIYLRQNDRAKALNMAERGIDADPGNARCRAVLATLKTA